MHEKTLTDRYGESSSRAPTPSISIFWYSQTGQLVESVTSFIQPLEEAGWRVQWIEVKPKHTFPFPWPIHRFFGVFPACVDPDANVEINIAETRVHLTADEIVLFAFQVWYLSPSLPMRSALTSYPHLFRNRDVFTFVACRNMWWSAVLDVRRLLGRAGARYRGVIAATDTSSQLNSLVTTLRWLLTGSRGGFWWFDRAGVNAAELQRLRMLGEAVAAGVCSTAEPVALSVVEILADNEAAPLNPTLAAADLIAGRAFRKWGTVIRFAARYGFVVNGVTRGAFLIFLGFAIVVGLPALSLIRLVRGSQFEEMVASRVERVFSESDAKEIVWIPRS